MTDLSSLKGAQQRAIDGGASWLGDLVSYDAERIQIPRADLRAIFDVFGFAEHVIDAMDPKTALSRAARKPLPAQIIIEVFAKPNKDTPHALGVYLKRPRDGESGDEIVCGARVRVERDTVRAMPPEHGPAIGECLEIAQRIAGDANHLIHFAETTDVSAAVISVITGPMMGIAMRKRGGFYFIRPSESATWLALCDKLAQYNFFGLSCPMAGDDRSRHMAQHNVRGAFESDLAELRKQLSEVDEKTRDSTIDRRLHECTALVSKAELYEEILGGWLDTLRTDAAKLKTRFQARLAGDEDVFDLPKAEDEPIAAE